MPFERHEFQRLHDSFHWAALLHMDVPYVLLKQEKPQAYNHGYRTNHQVYVVCMVCMLSQTHMQMAAKDTLCGFQAKALSLSCSLWQCPGYTHGEIQTLACILP